ncbi:hypothetical protein GCM10027187_70260 [Streptosporangium sandarakinum]
MSDHRMSRAQPPLPEEEAAGSGMVRAGDEVIHFNVRADGNSRVYQAEVQQFFLTSGKAPPGAVSTITTCPYPGLSGFDRRYADWFFGRGSLLSELIARLDRRQVSGGIQVVEGKSGAGKSSLLQAGLLRELDLDRVPGSSRWHKCVFTPSNRPVEALTEQLAQVTGTEDPDEWTCRLAAADGPRLVVVIDQFEELFTLCDDEEQRRRFVQLIVGLSGCRDGRRPAALVVIGVRADFYPALSDHPELRSAFHDGSLRVGAMSEAELREAVLRPAEKVGLSIERGLVELLFADLGVTSGETGPGSYEEGRLPLLAHALRTTWQQRDGDTLTVDGYKQTGRIYGALAKTADQVYDRLPPEGGRLAERLLVRLVKVGEQSEDARRRILYDELVATSGDPPLAAAVVDQFTSARLLTRHRDTVEITHEALLRDWPRLHTWLNTDRIGRLSRQKLEEAASTWEKQDRDPSFLYRGANLEQTREIDPAELSTAARAFLTASRESDLRERRIRFAAKITIAVLVLILLATTGVVIWQGLEAAQQRDMARASRIMVEADRQRESDASLSAQLALAAHRVKADDDTFTRVISEANSALPTPLLGHADVVNSITYRPDGRVLASAGDDLTIRLWDLSDPARPVPLGRPIGVPGAARRERSPQPMVFSPDGHTLIGSAGDETIRAWDVSDPARPVPLGRPITGNGRGVTAMALSPDGRTLASGDDVAIRLWDVTDMARPLPLGRPLTGHAHVIDALTFVADGHALAGADGQTIRLWNLDRPARPTLLGVMKHTGVKDLASVGETLASAGEDETIRLWNISRPERQLITEAGRLTVEGPGGPSAIALSPDGRTLAVADSGSRSIVLWDVSDPARPTRLSPSLTGHTSGASSLAFGPDGRTLASASYDRSLLLWNLPGSRLAIEGSAMAFGPGGRMLASLHDIGSLRLWDVPDQGSPRPRGRPLRSQARGIDAVAMSPDGRMLAICDSDGHTVLWDLSDPAKACLIIRRGGARAAGKRW